ncbi:Dihydroneopterin aldolase [Candidatus Westeberhardia cardiocondylae]|uniref:Dihydroneopterin aldolase n=1 Tax=Candidatus Westeberhardia cardiocondylae TaxID=1594731 RepID=A0A0H5BWL0_9ENTR|nr:dihydroneopterin aldolase [Candidatus Westeberhardia cardiocondylae]CEN32033.1 Dihydroneopterin aldolase [Candidatus Westeberhardia cardiocondylae]
MDILFIKKLTILSYIGIYEWEKKHLQKITIDIKIRINNTKKNKNNTKKFINYINIVNTIMLFMKNKHFYLIEDVAEKIATMLIKKFQLSWLQLKISKPSAIPQAKNVSYLITRKYTNINNIYNYNLSKIKK